MLEGPSIPSPNSYVEVMHVEEATAAEKSSKGPKNDSLLLRLFESELCNASLAVQYLFNSKEQGVLSYLGTQECAL